MTDSRQADMPKSIDRIQSVEVLGSRETPRLTATQHLTVDILDGERIFDELGECFTYSREEGT